jgi:cellulose synthase/poly-beta-1,6-N-acetylglucosamine synthase-like glycosyltransferase
MSAVVGFAPGLLSSNILSSVLPTFTDWLTLTVALTWVAAGLLLLFFGWLSLPRSTDESAPPAPKTPGSTGLRIIGGMVLAFGALVVASFLLTRSSSWSNLSFGVLGGVAVYVFSFLAGVPFVVIGRSVAGGWQWFLAWLQHGVIAIGQWVAGFGHTIVHTFPFLAPVAQSLWNGSAYSTINLIALVLTVAVGGVAGWMSSSSRWRASGVLTFLGLDFIALGLIGFTIVIVEHAGSPIAEALGLWLLGIELLGMFLFLAYQFYTLEYLTGKDRARQPSEFPVDPTWVPIVLVQVASYNEPPEIVENCLESVLRLDYPEGRFYIQLVDDTTDAPTVNRLREFCRLRGIDFRHRTDRRGFKGGALNDGLAALNRPVDLIAIVDSDYEVEPGFLKHGVQPFRDATIGFVQTPQAYRNAAAGSFARWYALADAYFYRVIQPVRARAQSMIFCGTMGLLRRRSLIQAGGWSETCVTEDAELSMRLIADGWRGYYIPTIYGWGLAPDLMSAVRSQHRRWAFGGLQMLRMNKEKMQTADLSLRQRVDFKMGGLFWVDGLFLLGVTAALATIVVVSWFGVTLPIGSTEALAVIASAPLLLMLDGLVKIRIALRSTTPISYRDTLGIMAFWYAIKLNDLRAALRGWMGARIPFVRTPKTSGPNPTRGEAFSAALRGSALETTLSGVLVAILVITMWRWGVFAGRTLQLGPITLLVWLGYYALAFGSALAFDYFSRRGTPPETLPHPVAEQRPRRNRAGG